MREIRNTRDTIRIPVHASDYKKKIFEAEAVLTAELERKPTLDEVYKQLKGSITKEDIQRLKKASRGPLNLENTIGNSEKTFADVIADTSSLSPLKETDESLTKVAIGNLLVRLMENLSERQREILRLRNGLGNGKTPYFRGDR